MYLKASRYIGGWKHQDRTEEGKAESAMFKTTLDAIGNPPVDDGSPSLTVKVNVGYWRKANAVHGWFVERVQGGEDECREHDVSREQLLALRNECQAVLNGESEGMKPRTGFFFGSQERDQGYFDDLCRTVKICDRALAMSQDWSFTYQSSW